MSSRARRNTPNLNADAHGSLRRTELLLPDADIVGLPTSDFWAASLIIDDICITISYALIFLALENTYLCDNSLAATIRQFVFAKRSCSDIGYNETEFLFHGFQGAK